MNHPHVGGSRANINGRIGACDTRRLDAGVFKRFPSHFEHHALLRIERLSLFRTHAEKRRIERLDVADDACCRRAGSARSLPLRMPVAPYAEA